ncbi:MFS general substrate transporter [Aspergillus saccharolyticus JOP 1030-1]|uniref:MFS general substrate transporter n=1 Tax=Aspergillus saccharolyticus JOP 1030-1 TaxID=1450539 RepID=A0A318ZK97_9EURO|nr:MFS general substrate transporter [Aspergillus saccharolyticus JOP 1030-1]PYH44200.1 MFS general substrate transporter [Aspergillus saccharolyticus JOP 1030-1]
MEPKSFPTYQLFLLGLCRIAEPVALTSPLPYAYDLMIYLLVDGDNNNNGNSNPTRSAAAFYAGIFVAAFSLAETLTAFWWGYLSDRIGRKPVLLLGCAGTILSLFVLGFAQSLWTAILGRALGGALNGNVGVVQTMVGEMVGWEGFEARAYAVIPFFFSIGCTIGPALGGLLAQQAGGEGVWGSLLRRFPYLLPNLACAGMVLLTMVLAWCALEETHPECRRGVVVGRQKQQQQQQQQPPDQDESSPLLTQSSNSTLNCPFTASAKPSATPGNAPTSLWNLNRNVKMLISAVCLLSAHTVTYIQLLPIFLRTPRDPAVPPYSPGGVGGLDMSLSTVGLVMGLNGTVGLAIQLLFPVCTEYFGLRRTLLVATYLHPLAYFSLPYLPFLPAHGGWRSAGLWVWLVARNVLSSFTYPALLLFIKRGTPDPLILGRVNGLVTSAGAACRTFSPALAGLLQSVGEHAHCSALAWWGSGVIAVLAAVQTWFVRLEDESVVSGEDVADGEGEGEGC